MIGDDDVPDAREGDMISFQYLRQSRSGLCLKRNDDRLLVETDGRRRVWVDRFDVESIDATAQQLLETKRANEAAAKRLALTTSAAAVHAAATAALESKQQQSAATERATTPTKKSAIEESTESAATAAAVAAAASPTLAHEEDKPPVARGVNRPHWLDDDDGNVHSNDRNDGDDDDDDNESIAVVTGLYEELAAGCGWEKVSTAEDMAIAFASQVSQRRSNSSSISGNNHDSFEATAAASLEAMAEWFCATPRALQAAQACGLVALLKALRKHHPNLCLQRAAGQLFDQWQAQHKAVRSAHRAARARTISSGGGGGAGGNSTAPSNDEGANQTGLVASDGHAENASSVEGAYTTSTSRVNRSLFGDDNTSNHDLGDEIHKSEEEEEEEEEEREPLVIESEEEIERRRAASEMEEALARRAADNADALAAKQKMAAAASARAEEAMAVVRAMARRRAQSAASSSGAMVDGSGEGSEVEEEEAFEVSKGTTAQADAAAGGSASASHNTHEATTTVSSSTPSESASGRHKQLNHPRGAVALPGIGGNLTPFPTHEQPASSNNNYTNDNRATRTGSSGRKAEFGHGGGSYREVEDSEQDNHDKLIRQLHHDLAAAVGWHGGSELGPEMGTAGAGAVGGEEVTQVKLASAVLKQLWELGAKEEWLSLVESCGLNRLLKAVKRFHHDARVRAQAQAVFEEWTVVARQAASASADAHADVGALEAPPYSTAAAAAAAAAAANVVPRSPQAVAITPLFVQLQQFEDELSKSVGWNGRSLDATIVSQEDHGSSALARTQKALKGLWRLDVSSDLLAFTDGQRCLALLRALERSHPVEKVRLQAAALCDKWNSILQSTQGEGPPSSSLPPSPRQQEQPSSLSPPSPSLAGVSSLNSNDAGGAASGAATVVIPFVPPEVVAARAAGSSSPHAQYLCPLTQELMVDPVLAEDELTYERSAIESWLANHCTSPADPLRELRPDHLIANRAVRDAIEKLVLSTPDSGGLDTKLVRRWKWRKQPPTDQAKLLLAKGRVVEAAQLGLPAAMGQLAALYFYGQGGVERDPLKAFAWAQKAASSGDGPGMFRLAYCYHVGSGTPNGCNFASALRWYEAALQQGEVTACHSIATLYFTGGPGLGRDQERAVSWYRKAADDHHLSHAQCALGWRYARGEGVAAVDLGQAAHWFELAALQGHCEAMSALGCLLLSATDLKLREIALPPPLQQQQQQPSSKTEASDGSPTSTPPLTKVDASSARTSCGLAWLERGAALGDESSSVALQRARASLASLDLLEKMARGPHREHIPDNR